MNQNNEGVLGYWNRDTVTIGGLPVSNQAFAQGNCFTDTACPNLQSSDPKAKFDVSVLILISVFNIYIQLNINYQKRVYWAWHTVITLLLVQKHY